jgi:hypothetical protein
MPKETYLSRKGVAVKLTHDEIKGQKIPIIKLVFSSKAVREKVAAHLTKKVSAVKIE